VNERHLEEVINIDFRVKLTPRANLLKPCEDAPMSRSLPIWISGLALPRVDFRDVYSNVFGMAKRVLRTPPPGKRAMKRALRKFVHKELKLNYKRLDNLKMFDFDAWIVQTDYAESRKAELSRAYHDFNEHGELPRRIRMVKSFIKDEAYSEYKLPRWINSRSDVFKCLVGPAFHAIEQEVFKKPEFIKYIPVSERPEYLNDHLHKDGYEYFATDFSSFESHFISEVMLDIEMQLYKHMLSGTPEGRKIYKLIQHVLAEKSYVMGNHAVNAEVRGKRMSGEMCTSLGNGFSNLMLIKFACVTACGSAPYGVIVEGDDGLFTVPKGSGVTAETFEDLGFRVKIEKHRSVQTASFCGNIYDYMDQVVLTDPRKVLVNFGWTKRTDVVASDSRLEMLCRAKGYSMAHQYRGCPIIGSFANYVLRATRRAHSKLIKQSTVNDKSTSHWERALLLKALKSDVSYKEPSIRSREIIADTYKISIADQKSLEVYFENCNGVGPIDHPLVRVWDVAFPAWSEFYDSYSASSLGGAPVRVNKDPAQALKYLRRSAPHDTGQERGLPFD